MMEAKLSTFGSQCRGRNGWFVPAVVKGIVISSSGEIFLDVYSRKPGKNPPIRLALQYDDFEQFRELVNRLAEEISEYGAKSVSHNESELDSGLEQ